MKTKEERSALKREAEERSAQRSELTEAELKDVVGGIDWLKEESNAPGAWYGLENDAGFKPGRRA